MTTYKVMFSDDLGQTWRLWVLAPAEIAVNAIADLVSRGYDRDLSIRVDSQPPQEFGYHMDVTVPGEEVIFSEPITPKQRTLFGEPA